MNINKKIKPDLVDPRYRVKIRRTLNPPKEDYWKPTKTVAQTLYSDYIRPNMWIVIVIIGIIIFLLYRYRIIQNQRIEESFQIQQNISNTNEEKNISHSNIAMQLYKQQKEQSLEPKVNTNKYTDRVEWAKPKYESNFAYPVFPNVSGGKLVPSTVKK